MLHTCPAIGRHRVQKMDAWMDGDPTCNVSAGSICYFDIPQGADTQVITCRVNELRALFSAGSRFEEKITWWDKRSGYGGWLSPVPPNVTYLCASVSTDTLQMHWLACMRWLPPSLLSTLEMSPSLSSAQGMSTELLQGRSLEELWKAMWFRICVGCCKGP